MACTICDLPWDVLAQVNQKLKDGVADAQIAREYNISKDALGRHRRSEHHLRDYSQPPAQSMSVEEIEQLIEVGSENLDSEGLLKIINQTILELKLEIATVHGKAKDDKRNTMYRWVDIASKIKGMLQLDQQRQVKRQVEQKYDEIVSILGPAIERLPSEYQDIMYGALENGEQVVENITEQAS